MADCLFCGIANREIKGSIVYENETVVVFKDINPRAPVHLLIIPRKHVATLLDLGEEDKGILSEIFSAANRLAESHGIAGDGFRVVVNCGPAAGQSVYHIHFHLLGGRTLGWPPG
ncbi:MAG: histidine triad nucleotide-binding protein [Deltaproteobacteria bacterium]|nr:histidine triad nucleotide-binding protein [Deltaproteobacteria bacterium]